MSAASKRTPKPTPVQTLFFVVVVVDRPSQLITGFVVVGYERACLLACRVLCFLVSVVVVVLLLLLEEIYWLCPSG